jgi:flagellar biosynthesis protein FlhB
MADIDHESKTLEPTPRRRERFRAEGKVAYSKDLSAACVLGVAVVMMLIPSVSPISRLKDAVGRSLLPVDLPELTLSSLTALLLVFGQLAVDVLWPMMLAIVFTSLAVGLAQSGFRPAFEPLQMNAEKLSPAHNWRQFLSMQTLVSTGAATLKLIVILLIFGVATLQTIEAFRRSPGAAAMEMIQSHAGAAALQATGVIFALALADYLYQRYRFHQQLRMSPEELKQEIREEAGDPQYRSWRKRRMQEILREGGLADVKDANVVVTNPTHLAIALRYQAGRDTAPVVLAKGSQLLAHHIRETARKLGIPIVERKPLARALYATVRLGDQVPVNLYHAVAEVIRHIMSLKNRVKRAI